ncbi:MAG: HAD family hydrolase [Erysipelotrichaceae bacterium]|nr:HAD family hydrolase [Erysipelotrichaceae bacterium]
MIKKIITILLSISILLTITGCKDNSDFSRWNDNDSLDFLIDYVKDVTDEKSENFIPVEDRIAVFDMDGTLYSQTAPYYVEMCLYIYRILKDPTYTPSDEQMQIARQIMTDKSEGDTDLFAKRYVEAFAGMSVDDYDAYVKEFLTNVDAEEFDNMKYCDLWYKPMLEIVDYLNKNDFTIYICSGTDRDTVRAMVDGYCNVDGTRIIGSDVELGAIKQTDSSYVYSVDDKVVRTDVLITPNDKAEKVSQLAQEIGKRPVLSFGNSDGDVSMHMYTLGNDNYKSAAFMLVNDDDVREHGNPLTANDTYTKWQGYGFYTFSIKDDFKEVFK